MSVSSGDKIWQLVADVGGTNARFAVVDLESESLCHVVYYSVAEHEVFADVLTAFCTSVASAGCWAPTLKGLSCGCRACGWQRAQVHQQPLGD